MRKFWLLLLTIIALASCTSTKTDLETGALKSNNWLIVGKYYGFCLGDCTTLYKITDEQLFEDSVERFMDWDSVAFKPTPLEKAQHQTAKPLLENFPAELLEESRETIGCPNCADQGAFVIEWHQNGETRRWRLDTNRSELPDYLQSYVARIDAVLERLKE